MAWCFGLSSGLFLVIWLVWMTSKKESVIWNSIEPISLLLQKLLIWVPRIAGLSMAFIAGMAVRDSQLARNQQTYTDVAVLEKFADRDFKVWPDRMKQQRVQICPESTVDWYEGEVLDDWTFEQKQGCKRVISYHEKPKGGTNVRVSFR